MLKILPDLTFPVTRQAFYPLMEGVVNLNFLNAGLTGNMQRGLSIMLHTHDLWVKSKGKIDYRGVAGHEKLKQDTETFMCGSGVETRVGDLSAAHLAIDYHDTCVRIKGLSGEPLPNSVSGLLALCADLCSLSETDEKRIGLLLDYAGKKPSM